MDTVIIKAIFDSGLKFIELVIDRSAKMIAETFRMTSRESNAALKEVSQGNTKALAGLVLKLENAIGKIQDPKFTGEIHIDSSEFRVELQSICDEIKRLTQSLNTSKMEMGLKMIYDRLSDGTNDKAIISALQEIQGALNGLKITAPDTIRIDANQMRDLVNAPRSTMSLGGQGVQPARQVTLTNLSLSLAATQYSYIFPSNTVRWTIKLRDQGTLGYYSYTTGKLPTSGDGTKYATIPQNFLQSEDGIDWSGKTIYLGAESDTQTAEIIVYTL